MAKVLIVDDDPDIRATILTYLGTDYDILTACDGQEALEIFLKDAPQVVVADIKMPRMSGLELSRRIRETGGDTAIIILTGYGDMDHVVEAIELSASDFLSKPLDTNQLRQAIDQALQKKKKLHPPKL